ncbi:tetratricopeptide repeat protein [Flavobacterium sp.]|uniref:tetratricopeptide repeat protein n=1 Tax=Flavobacterium sp. TaxID=239 RepID=UPI00260AE171|nr:tetratricopeptide repeat protein [Flavobacterium sp.]
MFKILLLGGFLLVVNTIFGQTDPKKIALEKGQEAIKLMDNGKIEESIKLLKDAQKLDPDRLDYPYELALAYYKKSDYNEAIKILEQFKNHKKVNDRFFQLLGNSYDYIENSEKAIEIYDEGLKLFPKSGSLYLEKGNVYWHKKDYLKALSFYEDGIKADPSFPSNYYRAARIYCSSSEEVWGLIYGEIFMNLERNSSRTSEISKLLFDTYNSQITIDGDTTKIDFCNIVIDSKKELKKKNRPFCMVFGKALILSFDGISKIDINSLDKLRSIFIQEYYRQGSAKTHPNVLFEYQKKILELGHAEAYNHWILMKGDEDKFIVWQSANQEKWNNFISWFKENKLEIGDNKKFCRLHYE